MRELAVAVRGVPVDAEITSVDVDLPGQPLHCNDWSETARMFADDPLQNAFFRESQKERNS